MRKRLEALRKATEDPEPAVRQAAVRSLSAVEEAMDIERLARLAHNGKKQARLRALYALRDCGSPSAVDALGALVRESDDADVRSAAASCLGERGTEAAPHLRDALDDPERSVAEEAMRAVARVGGEEAVGWIIDAARRRQPLEDVAIEALGVLGDDRAAEFLTEFIRDGSAEQQCAAAQALARLGPEVAEDALIATMEAEDANLRRVAVEALGELRPPRLEAAVHAGSSAGA